MPSTSVMTTTDATNQTVIICASNITIIKYTTIQYMPNPTFCCNNTTQILYDITTISWCENDGILHCFILKNNSKIQCSNNPMFHNIITLLYKYFKQCDNTTNDNTTSANTTNAYVNVIINGQTDGKLDYSVV